MQTRERQQAPRSTPRVTTQHGLRRATTTLRANGGSCGWVIGEERISELQAALAKRDMVIAELRSRIAELEAMMGQDSGNSSTPPARDKTDRRARRAAQAAERKAAKAPGKKSRTPGKQPGAPGATLERRAPTATVTHRPEVCRCCQAPLADAPVTGTAAKQVQDIPEPSLTVTDHGVEGRRCACGAQTTAVFPVEAIGPLCWGPRTKVVAAYLMGRQHLPLERCTEAMKVLFDAGMSEGTLAGVLLDAASRVEGFMGRLGGEVAAGYSGPDGVVRELDRSTSGTWSRTPARTRSTTSR